LVNCPADPGVIENDLIREIASKVKELGGTGRVHNWKLSRKIVESIEIPVFLAGGINPGNAKQAMDEVQPFGLDLCSGVRTNGKLDREKLDKFFKAIE
jgi:phosphoribosylanthranilate isomerase